MHMYLHPQCCIFTYFCGLGPVNGLLIARLWLSEPSVAPAMSSETKTSRQCLFSDLLVLFCESTNCEMSLPLLEICY